MIDPKLALEPLVSVGKADETPDFEAWREFVRLCDAGQGVALVTVIGDRGSSPRGMGAGMTVRADGSIVGTVGGGNLEQLVIRHALDAIHDGRARRLHYDYSGGRHQNLLKACRGQTEFFIQPGPRSHDLYVFGAGHIGLALAEIAPLAGFTTHLIDDRDGFPRPQLPPRVHRHHLSMTDAAATLPFSESHTYVVIVTYGHTQDEAVLRACLHRPWRYLGLIGSHAKVAQVFKSLNGTAESATRLAAVRAPIGLDLGGRSPGEIAISIVAELMAVRNGKPSVQPLSIAQRLTSKFRDADGASP